MSGTNVRAVFAAEPSHPHDGYAYDGCKCVCCVNIRALANPAIIEERDRAEEWADRLAYAIGGAAIGEHSNLNNPWQNALDMVAPPPSDTPADGLPRHSAECAMQDDDEPCFCGVSDAYAMGLRDASNTPTDGP